MDGVVAGFFSFTEVTDPAEHRAYNEWHQLDHLPEQYSLPGLARGERWVSTPRCRAARTVSEPPLDPIHYVTCYLMTEPIEATLRGFFDLGAALHAAGRFHRHRRAHLSGPFRVVDTAAAPRVRVSPAAVPFRPGRGLHVTVEEGGAGEALDHHLAWQDVVLRPALLDVPGVAGIWAFATTPTLLAHHRDPVPRRVTVCYLDDDPLAATEAIAARTAAATLDSPPPRAGVRTVLAGPFETVTPWHWDWFDPRA